MQRVSVRAGAKKKTERPDSYRVCSLSLSHPLCFLGYKAQGGCINAAN